MTKDGNVNENIPLLNSYLATKNDFPPFNYLKCQCPTSPCSRPSGYSYVEERKEKRILRHNVDKEVKEEKGLAPFFQGHQRLRIPPAKLPKHVLSQENEKDQENCLNPITLHYFRE